MSRNSTVDSSVPSLFGQRLHFVHMIVWLALALALMFVDTHWSVTQQLRVLSMNALSPVFSLVHTLSVWKHNTLHHFKSYQKLSTENQQLKVQVLQQSVSLQKLNTTLLENRYLRDLWALKPIDVEVKILAEIAHTHHGTFAKKVMVNRGQNHQVLAGQAVVDRLGVVGQVTRVYAENSEVTLITDSSLAIPVQIERSGLRAVAFGNGQDNTLELRDLPENLDIRLGDRLITSGIDNIYPAGLAVATVRHLKRLRHAALMQAVCTPLAEVESHRQVLLVRLAPNPYASTLVSAQKPDAAGMVQNAGHMHQANR